MCFIDFFRIKLAVHSIFGSNLIITVVIVLVDLLNDKPCENATCTLSVLFYFSFKSLLFQDAQIL